MKHFLITVGLCITLFSCSDDNHDICCVNIDTDINIFISVQDDNDGSPPFEITPDSMELYYDLNGEMNRVFDSNMGCPKNICLYELEDEPYIRIFPNMSDEVQNPTITYLQWNHSDIDTIATHLVHYGDNNSSVRCDSVWYNGTLVSPSADLIGEMSRSFRIVK